MIFYVFLVIRSFFIVNKPTTTSAQSEASIHNDFTTHIQQSLGLACSFQHIMCDTSTNEKAECVALVCSLDGNGVVTGGGVPLELNGCGASVARYDTGFQSFSISFFSHYGNHWCSDHMLLQLAPCRQFF